MRSAHRWSIVTFGVAVLLALPWLVAHRPVPHNTMSAAALLARIQRSAAQPYSGYAESDGGLGLPVSGQFDSLADLLGGHTAQRVWWRGGSDWRVDTITAFGESDVHADNLGTWTWNYERSRSVRTPINFAPIRLPRTSDVLPSDLGRRLLSEARPSEVSRLPVTRIAGVDAAGLRLRPAQRASTIGHVDVWADPVSGLPLRVAVYGTGSAAPAMAASFLDFHRGAPPASTTAFRPPDAARVDVSNGLDVASGIDRLADLTPPARLAGLARAAEADGLGSIGVYGRGVTEFVAAPLWDGLAGQLSAQLHSAGAAEIGDLQQLSVGPLSLTLLNSTTGRSWLLAGTVVQTALKTAAGQIAADPMVRR